MLIIFYINLKVTQRNKTTLSEFVDYPELNNGTNSVYMDGVMADEFKRIMICTRMIFIHDLNIC